MKVLAFLGVLANSFSAQAADIASCSDPSGRGYYPEIGIVSKDNSGWSNETITGGLTKLTKIDENEYDIQFVDARKDIFSARQSGGRVMLLNRAESIFSILVVYPGTTAEVYTFLKDRSGDLEYLHTLSRAGDYVPIAKVAVMRGDCAYIDFDVL